MFTFLNTIILTALAAALIPILIHLFNKQKTKKIKFSSLRFLKKLEKHRLKNVKIYQILLLLIRTLLIIFLVFAFARPTFSGTWDVLQKSTANTTAVIILDDGLSMRNYDTKGNRFNRALLKLNQIINSFSIEDRKQILRLNNLKISLNDSLDFQYQECSYLVSNANSALAKANIFFENNPNINKELHIISDLQFVDEKLIEFAESNKDIIIYLDKIDDKNVSNISIDSLEFENKIFELNKPIKIKLYLRNQSKEDAVNVSSNLFINDKRMAQNNSVLKAQEQKTIGMTFIPKSQKWNSGFVEISDDDLLADNRIYFAFNLPGKFKVLFVDNYPSAYLESALETINNSTNIEVLKENYNALARENFFNYDVIMLANLPNISDSIIKRLEMFLNSGKGVILIPGDQTDPKFFNSSISPLVGNLKILDINSVKNEFGYFALQQIRKNNPILSEIFRIESTEISIPKFRKYFKFTNTNNFQNILSFNDGNPFLLLSNINDLNFIVFTSYFDNNWTDLHYKGIFIPLMIKIIKYAALRMDINKNSLIVGNDLVVDIPQDNASNSYQLISPDGERNRLTPSSSGSTLKFHLNEFYNPGNYRIEQNSKTKMVISANVDAKSLGKRTIDIENLVSEKENIEIIEEDENIINIITQARFGEELWKYIIVMVVLIILLETFLVKKIEGKI